MTPHVRITLLEFDALVAANRYARNTESFKRSTRQILQTGWELRKMSDHIINTDTISIILNSILRADELVKAEGRRRGIVFKD